MKKEGGRQEEVEGEKGGEGEKKAKDEDPSRSEGDVEFVITDFSRLGNSTLSPPTLIRNLPWWVKRRTFKQPNGIVCVLLNLYNYGYGDG